MIIVKNLIKDFFVDGIITRALNGISLEIKEGEFVAIMGPSGSGKSTLLHILSFLDRPTGANIFFYDKSVDNLTDKDLAYIRNKEMGFVFQSFNLLGKSTVYENVELPLLYSLNNISHKKRKSLIKEAVAAVGLEQKLFVQANRLSGGQKQRVAIARALINNPNIIFADEPTGNLDSKSGSQIMAILKNLNQSGKTIILVTHDRQIASYAKRLIILKDGVIESDTII